MNLCVLLAAAAASLADLDAVRTLELQGETHHVQGIECDAGRLWVTSVDAPARKGYLFEFGLAKGERRRTIEVSRGARFHPGGIAAGGEFLWVPVAEYRPSSTSVVQRRTKQTLAVDFEFEVADHIGCLAVTGDEIVGGNWGSREFYVWDHRGRLLRKIASPTGNAYQDLKFAGGRLVGSGILPGRIGAIDWLEYPSLRLVRRMTAGRTSRGTLYTQEGMTIRGDRLFLLPEDSRSRLFEFRLAP